MKEKGKINSNKEIAFFVTLFFGISLVSFWVFNGDAYLNELRYRFLSSSRTNEELSESIIELARQEIPEIREGVIVESKSYLIAIPKFEILAPVVFPDSDTIEDITSALDRGTVLYPGSVSPGDNGRAVILGHSSRAIWRRDDFSSVFSLINKLERGDEFYILENNSKKFVYKVFEKHFLSPEATNQMLAGPYLGAELNLITCYPIGSPSQRTIIRSTLERVEYIN